MRSTPDHLPAVVQMTEGQKQYLREQMEAAMAAKRGQQPLSPDAQAPSQGRAQQQDGAALQSDAGGAQGEEPGGEEDGGAEEAAGTAAEEEHSSRLEAAGSEETSGQDMPELPEPDA